MEQKSIENTSISDQKKIESSAIEVIAPKRKRYSQDIKNLIIKMSKDSISREEISKITGISEGTFAKWLSVDKKISEDFLRRCHRRGMSADSIHR